MCLIGKSNILYVSFENVRRKIYEKNSREKHNRLNIANTTVGLIGEVGIRVAVFTRLEHLSRIGIDL